MRQIFNIQLFERWLHENCGDVISTAPVNSMTPFIGEFTDGVKECIFIVKAEEWLYEPLKGKTIDDTVPMAAKVYMEDDRLIWGFDIEPDINLECEIPAERIKEFLDVMFKQEKITIVIVNHITMNIVWMTNNYPFWRVRYKFKPLFDHYGVG